MNKQEYLKLDDKARVEFLNNELQIKTIEQIISDLNIQKNNLINPLNQKGYYLVDNVFINVFTEVIQHTNVLTNVLTRLEKLENQQGNTNVLTDYINIPDGDVKLVSFRINSEVYDQWKEYTNKSKMKSQDLLSLALLEYIQNH